MQGTSLDEVFGNFSPITNTYLLDNNNDPYMYRLAETTRQRDISGSMLFVLAQEERLKSLVEEPPAIDTKVLQLRITIDDYKNLKEQYKYLHDGIARIETNIQELESAQVNAMTATDRYMKAICQEQFISKEEFEALQDKQKDLQDLQQTLTKKCLSEYKEKAMELHLKSRKIQTNLQAYSDFIKEGTREMVGPDAKPNSCSICFENEIDHCFVPCGHTFCEQCIKKSSTKKCMNCRTDIQKTIKLFLGV